MIETDRLILTRPTIDDFEDFHAMLSEPEVYRFLGNAPSPRPESWTKLLRSVGHWASFDFGIFAVREKSSDRFIGEVGIGHFERDLGADFDLYPEAAWLLSATAHGKGYATEAAQAAFRWFFQREDPQRMVCIIDPANTGSIRVAEKMGFSPFAEREYRGTQVTCFKRPA